METSTRTKIAFAQAGYRYDPYVKAYTKDVKNIRYRLRSKRGKFYVATRLQPDPVIFKSVEAAICYVELQISLQS